MQSAVLPTKIQYIPILDGWRAVAILMVVGFHSLYSSGLRIIPDHPGFGALVEVSSRMGALGVLIFFGISGYLITLKMLSDSDASGRFSMRNFYIKRFFRIVPPLVVYLLALVLLDRVGVVNLVLRDWAAPFFLTNYFPLGSFYTSHFWSLSVEEHFYLVWPLCIRLAGWRRVIWVGLAVIVAVGVWRPYHLHQITYEFLTAQALQHTEMRMDYIMMGCVVALAVHFYPWAYAGLRRLGTVAGLALLLFVLVLTTLHSPVDTRSLQGALLTLIVCGSATTATPLMQALLANPAMLFVGRISYSLYIWQELFLAPSKFAWVDSPVMLAVKLPLAFLLAWLSYSFVERPCIAYGRRFLSPVGRA